jgi:hypothetical protein
VRWSRRGNRLQLAVVRSATVRDGAEGEAVVSASGGFRSQGR